MTMKTRVVIGWLVVLLMGVLLAIAEFAPSSVLTDSAMYAVAVLVILSVTVAGWRLKRRLKERMQRGLGREVDDIELTSITAWMRIPDQAARAAKEADKFDFDE